MNGEYIQLQNNGYTVKIGVENIWPEMVQDLLNQIKESTFKWFNFFTDDRIYYHDGISSLLCKEVNHENKVIVFQ